LIGKDFQEIADFQVIGYLMDSLTLFGIWWIVWHVWWKFGFGIWSCTSSLPGLLLKGFFGYNVFIYKFWMLFDTFFCQQDFWHFFYVSIYERSIVFRLLRDGILTLQRTYYSFYLFSWHIGFPGFFRIQDV
jgi:hypothetical protein